MCFEIIHRVALIKRKDRRGNIRMHYLCIMKLLAFIFSIYVLALPCLPCMDVDECNEPMKGSVVQAADNCGHQDEDEACAPFCNCSCCGQTVTSNFHTPRITTAKTFVLKNLPSYYNTLSLPSDYFGNIWQPPRFS